MKDRIRLKTIQVSECVALSFPKLLVLLAMTTGIPCARVYAGEHSMVSDENVAATNILGAMVRNSDYDGLVNAMKQSPHLQVRLQAISALAEHPDRGGIREMVNYLESRNVEAVEGGSEQHAEHVAIRSALVEAISRALDISIPNTTGEVAVASFISRSRAILDRNDPTEHLETDKE